MNAKLAEENDDDEDAPDLEEVDLEELERIKQEKQTEWLNNIIVQQEIKKSETADD